MSEESKTADSDYVMMGKPGSSPGGVASKLSIDDPTLSQEERDHRLALAMQQQENAAVQEEQKKKSRCT